MSSQQHLTPGAQIQFTAALLHKATRQVHVRHLSGIVDKLLGPLNATTVHAKIGAVRYPSHIIRDYYPLVSNIVQLQLDAQHDAFETGQPCCWRLVSEEAAGTAAPAAGPAAGSRGATPPKLMLPAPAPAPAAPAAAAAGVHHAAAVTAAPAPLSSAASSLGLAQAAQQNAAHAPGQQEGSLGQGATPGHQWATQSRSFNPLQPPLLQAAGVPSKRLGTLLPPQHAAYGPRVEPDSKRQRAADHGQPAGQNTLPRPADALMQQLQQQRTHMQPLQQQQQLVGAMAVQHPQQPAAQSSTLLQMLPGTQQQQAGAATQHQQPPSNTTRRQRKPRQQKPQLQPPASVSRPLLAASQQQAGVQQHALWRVMRERAEAAAAAVTATAGAEGQAAAVDEDDTLQHDRATLSKYVGVWSRLRSAGMRAWDARLSLQGNPAHLGTYETDSEAAMAYDLTAIRLKGREAGTNFGLEAYEPELAAMEAVLSRMPHSSRTADSLPQLDVAAWRGVLRGTRVVSAPASSSLPAPAAVPGPAMALAPAAPQHTQHSTSTEVPTAWGRRRPRSRKRPWPDGCSKQLIASLAGSSGQAALRAAGCTEMFMQQLEASQQAFKQAAAAAAAEEAQLASKRRRRKRAASVDAAAVAVSPSTTTAALLAVAAAAAAAEDDCGTAELQQQQQLLQVARERSVLQVAAAGVGQAAAAPGAAGSAAAADSMQPAAAAASDLVLLHACIVSVLSRLEAHSLGLEACLTGVTVDWGAAWRAAAAAAPAGQDSAMASQQQQQQVHGAVDQLLLVCLQQHEEGERKLQHMRLAVKPLLHSPLAAGQGTSEGAAEGVSAAVLQLQQLQSQHSTILCRLGQSLTQLQAVIPASLAYLDSSSSNGSGGTGAAAPAGQQQPAPEIGVGLPLTHAVVAALQHVVGSMKLVGRGVRSNAGSA